jgi:hypothetical protein
VAKTRVFVAVAFALLIPNAKTEVGTSLAPAYSFNAAPTTWTFEGLDLSGGVDSSYREADDSTAETDERRSKDVGESYGGRHSAAVAPLAIASIPAIDEGDLAPIEPTLVIPIHAPPAKDRLTSSSTKRC